MEDLKIGTKIKIKSPGKLIFLDDMFRYCYRKCTINSAFNGLGYWVKEMEGNWNPAWFEVIEKEEKM